jgi:hypothetical protein
MAMSDQGGGHGVPAYRIDERNNQGHFNDLFITRALNGKAGGNDPAG